MNKRALRTFVLLHAIAILLFMSGTIDGPPIRAALGEVANILLLPGALVTFLYFEPFRSLNFLEGWSYSLVIALTTTAVNYAVWSGIALVARCFVRPSAVRQAGELHTGGNQETRA